MPGRGGRGRGRGRGGGRGGRGRGRGGGGAAAIDTDETTGVSGEGKEKAQLDLNKNIKEFFVGTASFEQHHDAQESNRTRYAAGMAVLSQNGVKVSQNARVRSLAAAWARKDHQLADMFLENREDFGLVEVLKALVLLDSARRLRLHEKTIKRLQLSGVTIKPKKMSKLKCDMDNLNSIKPKRGSASGALCKHIRLWVRKFSKEELEFYALHFPTGNWKQLADICHLHPEKDFPSLPWFLPFVYGTPAPESTVARTCRDVTAENVNALVSEYPVPYSHIKQFKDKLTNDSKVRIANYEPKLDTVLWYYEDLKHPEVDEVIARRLENGDEVNLPIGKLLERLLTLKMIRENIPLRPVYGRKIKRNLKSKTVPFLNTLISFAEKKLKDISLPLEAPIAVLGDASSSMDVAIRTSTIIASILTAITNAKLSFFHTENIVPDKLPETVEQALELAVTMKANSATAPAASLYPYYGDKEVIKTFILVTDEEENTDYEGYKFQELFLKYREEVYPSKLVFVSFLRGQHSKGQMVEPLKAAGLDVLQFKFDNARPDLTKLDNLFGQLSSETVTFEKQVTDTETEMKAEGLQKVFQQMLVQDNNMDMS